MAQTVSFEGQTYTATGTFGYASFYRKGSESGYLVKWHRSESAARKGTWDSPAMRKVWVYVGYAKVS